jgi:hypothetical protein
MPWRAAKPKERPKGKKLDLQGNESVDDNG